MIEPVKIPFVHKMNKDGKKCSPCQPIKDETKEKPVETKPDESKTIDKDDKQNKLNYLI